MPSSWAPPASLHFFGLLSYKSPMRPLRLGSAATRPSASWPMLHRQRLLHCLVKNRQCLRHIPVCPGGFCQQTTPAQSSPPSCCSSWACPEGRSCRLVLEVIVRAGTLNLLAIAMEKLSPLETSLLTVSTEKPCPLLVGTLVDLISGHLLPAQLSGPSESTLSLGCPSPARSVRLFGSTRPSRLAFAFAISAISRSMQTAIASTFRAIFWS
jgi:hypothetical protein